MVTNGIIDLYGEAMPVLIGEKLMNFKKITAVVLMLCLAFGVWIAVSPKASAATETYEMSEQYKSGKFYENFKAVKLSGDQASDVVAIALSQLGYHEGDGNKDLDGMNLGGTRDFVEYNVLYGKIDNNQGNGISYGYYWCASFVNWCLRQARVSIEASAAAEISCQRWLKKCKDAEIYNEKKGYEPIAGDMIFFRDKGSAVSSTHMGIVLYSDGETVYTIEGNTSNDNSFSSDGNYVAIKSYALDSSYIVGYATPDYEKADVPRVDRAPFGMSPGTYISKDKIELVADGESIATVDEHDVFSVSEICADGFAITYEKSGKIYKGFAHIEEKAVQMTASGGDFRTVEFLSEGKRIFNTYYLLDGTETRAPDERPKRDGAGFITWVELQDPTVSRYPDMLAAGETISFAGDHIAYGAFWDTKQYTVTFKDGSGRVIKEIKGYLGDSIEPPDMTDLPEEHYFEGWGVDELPDTIEGNATFTAVIRDETPFGRFIAIADLAVGLPLSLACLALGITLFIILYRKKTE